MMMMMMMMIPRRCRFGRHPLAVANSDMKYGTRVLPWLCFAIHGFPHWLRQQQQNHRRHRRRTMMMMRAVQRLSNWGCGFPSSVLARHKKTTGMDDTNNSLQVISTDFWSEPGDVFDAERLVPEVWHGINLRYNVESPDNQNAARVERLDWLKKPNIVMPVANWVIGSDLVYYPTDLEYLWTTLELFLDQGSKILIVAPKKKREALPQFIKLLEEKQQAGFLKLDIEEWTLYQGGMEDDERGGEVNEFLRFCFEKP
jgi:hypothetical protein